MLAETPRRFPKLRKLAIAATVAGLSLLFVVFFRIHPFLASTHRVSAKVLVVEGWIPDYAIEEAIREFKDGGYLILFTTGGPLQLGGHLSAHGDFAHIATATLTRLGFPTNQLHTVPTTEKYRNRTYASAVALKEYSLRHGISLDALNLVSEGTHARRSRLCFQRALGREAKVGVISVENRDYDSNCWWRYSSGVKTILGESLALLYAWFSIDYGD